ncbi:U4/U6.U5 tri-snRNP-associated protein 1-like [Oppia nitens]|uniref:U4/U6.U5 tri-snRNP-associated protein 1-like n=1 Tax=Oppia nitens TaxID=1686743 RepID=UPI0023DB2883|nr:U4/U6.U5 tri-snRNP-associated protein 1-like [Oppia nitens]
MGSSRRHRSRSKSRDRTDKSDRNHRSSDRRHKERESATTSASGSRKRLRTDTTSDEERVDRNDKKLKVKEVKDREKTSNSSVNKTTKLDPKSSDGSDKSHRRDGHHSKDDNLQTEGSNTESLSIEETNKLRAKLGLKPLDVGSSGDNNKDKSNELRIEPLKTEEVFIKTEKISDKIEAEKIREKIETQRNKRKMVQKLKNVKSLGESDDEIDNTSAWVIKTRKLEEEKERAQQRAKLLEEMDEEFGVKSIINEELIRKKANAYSGKNLTGLTVGHKVDSFKEGHQLILTLKDNDVLAEDDDVLENVNLVDDEKANKNIENKLKRPDYKPYDEPELDEFGILKTKSLLSKYDEELEGPKKESFKLGISAEKKANDIELIRMKLKQEEGKITLFTSKPKIASEYFTEEEMIKFKKPKKIRKVLRKKTDTSKDINENLFTDLTQSIDHGSRKSRKRHQSDEIDVKPHVSDINNGNPNLKQEVRSKGGLNFDNMDIDEDVFDPSNQDLSDVIIEEDEADKELQMALHKSRKLKQRFDAESTTGAASIAKVAETVKRLNENLNDDIDVPSVSSSNIILNSTAEFCRNLGDIPTYGLAGNRDDDEELMELMEPEEVNEVLNTEYDTTIRGKWNEVEVSEQDVANEFEETEGQPILEEEPDVTKGLVGALKLAMKKGYLDKEVNKHGSSSRQKAVLEAQSYTIEEKFYEDDKIGRRERYSGPVSEFREKSDYKPEIKLDYVDEKGRVLDQKEAFRHLSHKFHGKGPSKNKIDKRMKKKEQISKLQQMSSTDTPLNTLKMLTEKQKELQTPYLVLTGGQKTLQTISKTK